MKKLILVILALPFLCYSQVNTGCLSTVFNQEQQNSMSGCYLSTSCTELQNNQNSRICLNSGGIDRLGICLDSLVAAHVVTGEILAGQGRLISELKEPTCCDEVGISDFTFVGGLGSGTVLDSDWETKPVNPLRFKRDFLGTVYISGIVSTNLSGSGGIIIFNLPTGFRPLFNVSDTAFDFVTGNIAQVLIGTNGNVAIDFGGQAPNLVMNFNFHSS